MHARLLANKCPENNAGIHLILSLSSPFHRPSRGRDFLAVGGGDPDLKKVIKAILIGLDKDRYMQFNFAQLDETHQFIDELRDFLLENKRYTSAT